MKNLLQWWIFGEYYREYLKLNQIDLHLLDAFNTDDKALLKAS
jgi:hypothetical protein